jgi:hypothetical protein
LSGERGDGDVVVLVALGDDVVDVYADHEVRLTGWGGCAPDDDVD